MFTMLLILWLATFAVYVLPQLNPFKIKVPIKLPSLPEEPKTAMVHLFSGPNDGEVHEVVNDREKLPPFFITPYVPRDEDGTPIPDDDHIMRQENGLVYVRPSLAYYQQVTDEDYIYVRDINEKEFKKIQMTGELPQFQVKDD